MDAVKAGRTRAALLVCALVVVPTPGLGQEIILRPVRVPPPTTFAALVALPGPQPAGPCDTALVMAGAPAVQLTLSDSSSIALPIGWGPRPLFEDDDPATYTRFLGPGDTRARVLRKYHGASRTVLSYDPPFPAPGTTCRLDRGAAGAVWTMYERNPARPPAEQRFLAFGDLVTASGSWYSVTVSGPDEASRQVAATAITTALLLRQP